VIVTTATTKVSIVIECFPQVVDGFVAGFSTSIEENTNFRLRFLNRLALYPGMSSMKKDLDDFPNCIEKPAMRVDLLLILRLEDEDDLNRNEIIWIIGLGKNELRCSIDGKLSCILEETRSAISYYVKS